jgi:hypothetical protein
VADPNWAEQLTGIGTAVAALGLFGALGAAAFAGQQVREERKSRQAQVAADLFRRWSEEPLVEARHLIASLGPREEAEAALSRYIASNAPEAYVLFRELDYFEQLAALERYDAVDFELIQILLGPTLVERWEMWRPSIDATFGTGAYPLLRALVAKMRTALAGASG